MMNLRALGAVLVLLSAGAAACGSDESADPERTIDVTMTDNAFSPATFSVKAGETVTFQFHNGGAIDHEAIIGTPAEQADHESEMKDPAADDGGDMEGMGHDGADSDALTVEPGKSEELTHTFESTGTFLLGCHEPGHYAAGMKADITVT